MAAQPEGKTLPPLLLPFRLPTIHTHCYTPSVLFEWREKTVRGR